MLVLHLTVPPDNLDLCGRSADYAYRLHFCQFHQRLIVTICD